MKKTLRLTALSLVLVMMVAVLASCGGPNADPDKAVEALKDEGYSAVKDDSITPGLLSLAGIKDVDCVVSGSKDSETVSIIYFESSEACKESWEKAQEYFTTEDEGEENEDFVIKKSGKMIYAGTKEAIKAAG